MRCMAQCDLVKFGVLGLGNISRLNLKALHEASNCKVVALCDIDEEKLKMASDKYAIKRIYNDVESFLKDDEIQAVEILTPTYLHKDHVIAACEAQKHVSCQKPIANSILDTYDMQHAVEKNQVLFRVNEFIMFYPPVVKAKELIDSGAIGKPITMRIKTVVGHTDSPFQSKLDVRGFIWRFNKLSPGGHLFDDFIHKYGLAFWLVNQKITAVTAIVRQGQFFFESPAGAVFEYDRKDLLTTIDVANAPNFYIPSQYYGADEFIEIQGEEGLIWITKMSGDLLKLAPLIFYDKDANRHEFWDINSDYYSAFLNSAEHFARCIKNNESPMMKLEDAREALKVCFAVYKSSNEGRRVALSEVNDVVSPQWWPIFE